MDDHWYYAEASNRSFGPITIEDLGRVLRSKPNSVDFLVWCPGMGDWERAGDQFALRRYFQPPPTRANPNAPKFSPTLDSPTIEPELRVFDQGKEDSLSLHPWRRYFARIFDLYVFILIFFFFLGIAFPKLFVGSDKSLDVLYGILGSGAYAVFEGFCMNVFGGSLGKRLYGISVFRTHNEGFSLSISFRRSFAVWVRGLGFGIPIATLFTLLIAYRTLNREKQTSWDRDFQCAVTHKKLSAIRWIGILLAWLLVISVYSFLVALGNTKL
jgi:hypothetical protein